MTTLNATAASLLPVRRSRSGTTGLNSILPHGLGAFKSIISSSRQSASTANRHAGLLAYVNKETGRIDKFEGNPKHPASRGRLCAKGPATITQIHDPDRILYPMKRSGPRGGGKWTRTSWDEVLETFGARIRKAFQENRGEEVMYHVGRPGHDFIMETDVAGLGN